MMKIKTIQDVKNLCNFYGLHFKRGDFSKGERFKISLDLPDDHIMTWPCQTLNQCREAIFQADYLRHHKLVH